MKNLTHRMDNSRAWWQSEIRRRNDDRSKELTQNLAGLYLITGITLGILQLMGSHL